MKIPTKYSLFIVGTLILLFTHISCDEVKNYLDNDPKHQEIDTVLFNNPTNIEFLDSVVEIGTVKEGEKPEVIFKYKNIGDKPLMIFNVIPGCGCTVASYSFKPTMPGKTDSIVANFDSKGKEGPYKKSVIVQANTKKQTHNLFFKVEVVKK